MLCSTSTAIHLCADNRPWKENYNQSRGRKEGTAHPLQPNILIYKETIKYFKSKVASQPVHCDWIEEFLLIIFLPQIPPMLFSFFSSQSLNCPYFTTLVLFPLSLSLSFSLFFPCLSHPPPDFFHLCSSVLLCSSSHSQFCCCESIVVNIVVPYSSFTLCTHTLHNFPLLTDWVY